MKIKLTLHIILLYLLIIILPLNAQNPTYEARLMNDTLTSPNTYEFDIFIKRTGQISFEAYGLQVCLIFNDAIRNGGTLSAVYIPGTSEMNTSQIPNNPNIASVVAGKRVFKLAAKIPAGAGFGTIISNIANGTKLGRFRITTNAPSFALFLMDLTWNFEQVIYGYATKFSAYVSGISIDVTVQTNHFVELCYTPRPSYEAGLINDVQTTSNSYEFDIYIKNTSLFELRCCGYNISLLFNDEINGGGELTSNYIQGSSEMNSAQIPTNPSISSAIGSQRIWNVNAPLAMWPNNTLISQVGNGTKVGRFRIITSAPSFSSLRPNIKWNFNANFYGNSTNIYHSAQVCGIIGFYPVLITDSLKHYNNLTNPILPVELVSFSVNLINSRDVKLSWLTATETNNYGFDVERKCLTQTLSKVEGFNDWMKIGFVEGSGNSTSPKSYSYIDKTLTGGKKFAYRLKQIDHDGTFSLSSIQTIELKLNEYVLSQNYPNPFNPSTTIEYIIPEAGQVMLSVYNLLGEKVDEIVNELKESGIYQVDFDANKLSSGTYIYILRSNGNSVSKKMVVLR